MTLNITPIGLHSQHAQDYPLVIVTPATLTRWAAELRTTAAALTAEAARQRMATTNRDDPAAEQDVPA